MSNHLAGVLAPAKPVPVPEFHALGIHYHFTAGTAWIALVAFVAFTVALGYGGSCAYDAWRNRRDRRLIREYDAAAATTAAPATVAD